jgi:hypothetical protein
MVILYRASNYELEIGTFKSNRPIWFNKQKCFKSIIDALHASHRLGSQCELHVVLDGPRGDLSEYVESFKHVNIRQINANGNAASLLQVYDIYLNEFKNRDVYFVEDDYLHLPYSLSLIQEGVDRFNLVTGYDHTDRYTRIDDVSFQQESIVLGSTCHWRTAESTTCTWATRGGEWGEKIVNIAKQYLLEDRAFFRHLINSQIRLYTPIPGCTTHMNANQLSPFTNWQAFNDLL